MISQDKWKWYGLAGHFICGQWCRFHLCTEIGDYLVSTVGMMVHPRHSKGSEQAEAHWLIENPNGEEIGYQRTYETMVFKTGAPCRAKDCNCGQPTINGHEIYADCYNDVDAATKGHMKMCLKVARKEMAVSK